MKFIILILLFYFAFMVCYGFYSLLVMFGWLEEPQPPGEPPQPLNEPINIGLPQKVNSMEWEVSGNYTSLKSVRDVNSKPINLEL
jgi:hypothetical protein